MTKAELVEAVAQKLEVSKRESNEIIGTVIDTIVEGALEGKCVVPGLGKLVLQKTKGRSGISKLQGVDKAWKTEDSTTLKLYLGKDGKAISKV